MPDSPSSWAAWAMSSLSEQAAQMSERLRAGGASPRGDARSAVGYRRETAAGGSARAEDALQAHLDEALARCDETARQLAQAEEHARQQESAALEARSELEAVRAQKGALERENALLRQRLAGRDAAVGAAAAPALAAVRALIPRPRVLDAADDKEEANDDDGAGVVPHGSDCAGGASATSAGVADSRVLPPAAVLPPPMEKMDAAEDSTPGITPTSLLVPMLQSAGPRGSRSADHGSDDGLYGGDANGGGIDDGGGVDGSIAAAALGQLASPWDGLLPPTSDGQLPITDGWDGARGCARCLALAPPAQRPSWLPASGPGVSRVPAGRWALSIGQWVRVMEYIVRTDTWRALAEAKGAARVTMDDVTSHFVVPWTRGTGCSLALLMNADEPREIDVMLTQSWVGRSALETLRRLDETAEGGDSTSAFGGGVTRTANIFFAPFSIYQPQDGAPGGRSFDEQVDALLMTFFAQEAKLDKLEA